MKLETNKFLKNDRNSRAGKLERTKAGHRRFAWTVEVAGDRNYTFATIELRVSEIIGEDDGRWILRFNVPK